MIYIKKVLLASLKTHITFKRDKIGSILEVRKKL